MLGCPLARRVLIARCRSEVPPLCGRGASGGIEGDLLLRAAVANGAFTEVSREANWAGDASTGPVVAVPAGQAARRVPHERLGWSAAQPSRGRWRIRGADSRFAAIGRGPGAAPDHPRLQTRDLGADSLSAHLDAPGAPTAAMRKQRRSLPHGRRPAQRCCRRRSGRQGRAFEGHSPEKR